MADISMKRSHSLGREDLEKRITQLANKVTKHLGGSWDWDGDEAVCETRGAQARVAYDDESISMDVSLPLLLRPLRGRLEKKIDELFEEHFR